MPYMRSFDTRKGAKDGAPTRRDTEAVCDNGISNLKSSVTESGASRQKSTTTLFRGTPDATATPTLNWRRLASLNRFAASPDNHAVISTAAREGAGEGAGVGGGEGIGVGAGVGSGQARWTDGSIA